MCSMCLQLLMLTTYFLLPIRHTITTCCKETSLHVDIDGVCWVWSVHWSHTTCHDIHWHWHITLATEPDTQISALTPYVNTHTSYRDGLNVPVLEHRCHCWVWYCCRCEWSGSLERADCCLESHWSQCVAWTCLLAALPHYCCHMMHLWSETNVLPED